FGAGRAGASDHLQIDFVAAADHLAQPGGGACSQRPLACATRALALVRGIVAYKPNALALPVDRIAIEDINILGSDRLRMCRRHGEYERSPPQKDIHQAASSTARGKRQAIPLNRSGLSLTIDAPLCCKHTISDDEHGLSPCSLHRSAFPTISLRSRL